MRKTPNLKAERYRIRAGLYGSHAELGNYGAFKISQKGAPDLFCVVSEGTAPELPESLRGWEHVSVSTSFRCPTWEEMCLVKDLFWRDDEAVIQFHPPKSEYVNQHPYTLHLWKPAGGIATPPKILVGGTWDEAAAMA